jgi:cytochrome P450
LRPDVLPDPYPLYRQLRDERPVYWDEVLGSWVVSRHADCVAVLRDPVRFSSDWRRIGEKTPDALLSVQTLDPPEHGPIRHLLVDGVRAQDLQALEVATTRRVRTLLEPLAGRQVEFMSAVIAPLALSTMTSFLGVPDPDLDWFASRSAAIVDAMDSGLRPDRAGPGLAAREELTALVGRWLADRPSGGLVAFLLQRYDEWEVPVPVLMNSVRVVLHAGVESAGRFLGNGLYGLLRVPGGLRGYAAADPSTAVNELIRIDPTVQAEARAVVSRATLGGRDLEPGQSVTLLLGAANRDDRVFDRPDELRLDRAPNPHLGFGRGAHACLGSPLAALLGRATFGALAAAYPAARLAGTPRYRANATLRGLDRLDVVLATDSAG